MMADLDSERSEPGETGTTGTALWRAVLAVAWGIALVALAVSFRDALRFPGSDGRTRIVGARLLVAGRNPYSIEYQDDPFYSQLLWRRNGPSGVTYDPDLLLLYAPLARIPYRQQRIAWWGLEWLAMFASVGLIYHRLRTADGRRIFLVCAMLLFAASTFWRMHTERGQYYVFALLLLAVAWAILDRPGPSRWLFVLPLAVVTSIRPTFGVAGIALLGLGWWKPAAAYLLALVALVGVTLPMVGISGWRDFLHTSRDVSNGWYDDSYLDQHFGTERIAPLVAEGESFSTELDVPFVNFNGPRLLHAALPRLDRGFFGSDFDSTTRQSAVALAGLVTLMGILTWKYRGRLQDPTSAMLTVACFLMFSDFFAPVRISYADILLLLPAGLLMARCDSDRRNWPGLALLLLGMLLGCGDWEWLSPRMSGELRPTLALAGLGLGWLLTLRLSRRQSSEQHVELPGPSSVEPAVDAPAE